MSDVELNHRTGEFYFGTFGEFSIGIDTRTANAALTAAGARVVYREIDDLSHTYPRDENPRIMDWLLAGSPSGAR